MLIAHVTRAALRYLGLKGTTVLAVDAPVLGETPDEVTEDQRVLFLHWRLLLSGIREMLLYAIVPQTLPWIFCLLLIQAKRGAILQWLHLVWDLKHALEISGVSYHRELLEKMVFLRWINFRK